jgi:hypothetical protein
MHCRTRSFSLYGDPVCCLDCALGRGLAGLNPDVPQERGEA